MSETSGGQQLTNQSGTAVVDEAQEKENLKKAEVLPPQYWPQVDHLVTEDDTPVDNIFSERQQRLLVETLYISGQKITQERPFVALANVGLFYGIYEPPLVPDVLLSFDVSLPEEVWQKRHRSYFVWEYGKPPELVVEIVSNIKGEEAERKLHTYARIGIAFYVIFDPENYLKQGVLRVYQLSGSVYKLSAPDCLTSISLGLTLWHGEYEGFKGTWLRWCDCQGNLLLTGFELNEKERMRTEKAQQQAEKERTRAEQAELKNKRLIAQLQKLGIKPEE